MVLWQQVLIGIGGAAAFTLQWCVKQEQSEADAAYIKASAKRKYRVVKHSLKKRGRRIRARVMTTQHTREV